MRIIYRVEHKGSRRGCFIAEDRVEGYRSNSRKHVCARAHLRSMPLPSDDFQLDNSAIGKGILFAFPCMESMLHWLNYSYRVALQRAGFVIGLYRIKKPYRISDSQIMFTRHTARHMGDMPLVRNYKYTNDKGLDMHSVEC